MLLHPSVAGLTGHRKDIQSADDGPALNTSGFESLYRGQLTISTQLIKTNFRLQQ